MKNLFTKHYLLVIASAVLYVLIFYSGYSSLAWIFLIPLIYSIASFEKRGVSFRSGLLYGAVISIGAFYPLPTIIAGFAGGASVLGWVFSLVAALITALFFGGVLLLFSLLKKEKYPAWANALLLAALWSLSEWAFGCIFEGMPWFGFQMGNLLLENLYFIQPAEWGGLYLLSFAVVFVNAWAGLLLAKHGVKHLWKPAVFLACYFVGCFLLLQHAGAAAQSKPDTLAVAIMCENTAPEEKWNNDNGPQMVRQLLQLNQRANALKPDVVLWTESAVPWTYSPDDDFVQQVSRQAQASQTIQILGINSAYDSNSVYNSAYCILPDGKVSGRYDKRFLLSLAEKPISFLSLPFLNSTDGFYAKEGNSTVPLPTPEGNIGVLICNEAFVAASAIDMVRNGADYLVNISNDGWFSAVSFMRDFHFRSARLRAVEVRRDIAVNSNLGISGKIAATGVITDVKQGNAGFAYKVVLKKDNHLTLITKFPNFSLVALSILTALFALLKFFSK